MFKWNVTSTFRFYIKQRIICKENYFWKFINNTFNHTANIYGTANKSLERLQHQQNFLIRIVFGFPKHKESRSCRSKSKIPSIFELHVYELLKLLSKVIRREHRSESINPFITNKEIDRSFDNERRIRTIPLIEKLTRKKRKLISVQLRILYNSLSTLDFDIKSLRICKENSLKKLLHSFPFYTPFFGKMYW